MSKILFVYALDGGLFDEVSNFAHKVFSPKTYPCKLCTLTNGLLGAKREWSEFISSLGVETEFLHRDGFLKRFPTEQYVLPAVFQLNGKDHLEVMISSEEMSACNDLGSLMSLVSERVK